LTPPAPSPTTLPPSPRPEPLISSPPGPEARSPWLVKASTLASVSPPAVPPAKPATTVPIVPPSSPPPRAISVAIPTSTPAPPSPASVAPVAPLAIPMPLAVSPPVIAPRKPPPGTDKVPVPVAVIPPPRTNGTSVPGRPPPPPPPANSASARESPPRPTPTLLAAPLPPSPKPSQPLSQPEVGAPSQPEWPSRGASEKLPLSRASPVPSRAQADPAIEKPGKSTEQRQADTDSASEDPVRPAYAEIHLDGAALGRWMTRYLERQVMRPQVGTTGFDQRMTPSWPGAPIGN
jgi:hypothetical protein